MPKSGQAGHSGRLRQDDRQVLAHSGQRGETLFQHSLLSKGWGYGPVRRPWVPSPVPQIQNEKRRTVLERLGRQLPLPLASVIRETILTANWSACRRPWLVQANAT